MKILAIITFILITMNFILSIFRMIKHQKEIDAAYQRGIADAKQATTEVITDIKIKVREGKSLHDAANEVANELNRRLKETNTM